jgi:uncharacterized protein
MSSETPPPPPPESLRRDGPADAPLTLVLAHGAGAPMDSPFLEALARDVSAAGFEVARFEFPYMAARRRGERRPPDRQAVLERAWLGAVEACREGRRSRRLVVGGKSLGGRIASRIAERAGAVGLVCLGYPFHPPKRPPTGRIEHLATLGTPTLILQGTRDPFGTPEEVASYPLSPAIRLHWVADGDHGFKPRRRSGRTEEQAWAEVASAVVDFLRELAPRSPAP